MRGFFKGVNRQAAKAAKTRADSSADYADFRRLYGEEISTYDGFDPANLCQSV